MWSRRVVWVTAMSYNTHHARQRPPEIVNMCIAHFSGLRQPVYFNFLLARMKEIEDSFESVSAVWIGF